MSILDEIKKKREKEGIKAYEPKTYIPSKQTGKVAEKSAPSLRSGVKTNTTNIPDTNLFKGLNVSKPETKKLSGSDKDVFKRASALAADTGMSYAERKKQITQTQKELGKIRDKHLIASMMGNENAKKTIKQVTDLQNQLSQQLKSTAFGAGFGQAAGLDIYDTAVKKIAEKTGNTSLTARMKAQDDARAQVKAANKKSYGRGELAGELTQAAILYGTAGAAAEKAALAGMGRLTGGKTLGKAGTFATRMLGQQTADTVVNTPLTIAKGMEEGKDRGEIAEDVGKQFALDAAFNLGMGAIGAGAKAAGKAIGKAKESKAAGRAMDNAKRVQMDDSANKISSLSDHELLDQKAIVHHLKKNGVPVNKDNTVTLYHVTSPDNAKKIRENGFVGTNAPVGGMTGEELQPRSFFGIDKDWTKQWDSGGYEMIEIRVPAQYVRQGAQNANEVYIEGNIRHIGNGIWEPDTYPTSTFYDRRAVKRYQKDLGNNSVQKEASNVTLEKTEKVNETVGKQALTEADLPELAKESKAAVKTAREEAQSRTSEGKQKQVYYEEGFTAATSVKDGKEVTRYTNPALDKNPLEMEGVKELLNDSEFDMMDADATDYSAALGIKPINWTANKDFYRVMEEAGSLDPAAKEMLENEFVSPVKIAKDSFVTFAKDFFRDVLPVVQKTGIRRGTKESAAAQWYREGERLNAMGKKEPYSLAKLKQEFPDKWQDIIELDEVLHKWLDSMPAPLNENYKKIYPNVEANAVAEMKKHQFASEDFFKKARAEQERIDALEKRLGELKQQTAKDGTRKKADLEKRIINKERQIEKAKAEKERLDRNAASHSKKAKKWEDDIANGDIYENKRLLIRGNYYPHMTKRERGFKGLKAIGEMNQNIDPRLEGISEFTQPKTKWAGFMQHRKEGYYDADALGNTIDYMLQAGYKLYFDPVIANNRKVIKGIAEATKDSRNANGLLNFLTQYTNDLAGKTNPYFDRMLTNIGGNGRKVIAGLEWLNNRVKSNAVMGNFRSMTAQVFNIPNAAAYVKNPAAWSRGAKIMGDMVTGRNGAKELMESSTFLSERYTLDKLLNQFEEKNIGNSVERLASWMMTVGDEFATRLIWASAYSDAAQKGVTDAVRYADDIARKAVGGRGIGEMPILQKSRVYKFALPFSPEVNNSFQVLKEIVAKKDLAGLALMMGASYAMNSIPRELFGFDVSTDFVNALKEGLDAWDDEEQTFAENLTGVTGRLAGELISAIPSGAIISTLAFDEYKREKFFGDADPTRYGVGQVGVTTLTDPILDIMSGEDASGSLAHAAFSILPSVGGKSLERAYGGLQDMAVLPDVTLGGEKGVSVQKREAAGSYKDNGELRFPIEETPGNIAKLFAFGEYATKEGKKYLEDTNTSLSENHTQTYKKLLEAGAKNTVAFEEIGKIRLESTSQGKRDAIRNSKLNEEQKAILYYDLVAEKGSKDREILDWYEGKTSKGKVADCLRRMADHSGNEMAQRSILRVTDLSESDKMYVYLNRVISENSVENETERVEAARSVDIGIDAYFTIRNKYSLLKDQGGKVKNNWISWMRNEGYSGRQIYVMGEAFGWNMD